MLRKLRFGLLITLALAFVSNNLFADREQDSLALVALYNSSNGSKWNNNTNWLSDNPIDTWYGVELDQNGRVVKLDLSVNGLKGSITSKLANLTNLEYLDLNKNKLTGAIPKELGELTKLEYLNISLNDISSTIPDEFGNLTNLKELNLAVNNLNGPIPKELGNLTNLNILFLAGNDLEGTIPEEFGNLINLKELYLAVNNLVGPISKELGNLTNLNVLVLAGNDLDGTIPEEFGNLINLNRLVMTGNELTGSIPKEIGNLNNLEILSLNDNQLSGSIPEELGNLNKLKELALNDNGLSGSIPSELGNLTNLEELDLSDNELTGSIPAKFANLTNLEELVLFGNQLNGLIPSKLGNLTNLKNLYLQQNQFDFADFANVDNSFYDELDVFSYSPQDSIGIEEELAKKEGESITIEAGDKFADGNIYKWFKDGSLLASESNQNLEIQSLSKDDEGDYTCEVTNDNFPDLTLFKRPFVLKINTTSVNDSEQNLSNLQIYPNPASDFINISIDNDADLLSREVQILDLLGLVVSKTELTDGNNRIDISNLARGTYFIKVGDRVEKFVKM